MKITFLTLIFLSILTLGVKAQKNWNQNTLSNSDSSRFSSPEARIQMQVQRMRSILDLNEYQILEVQKLLLKREQERTAKFSTLQEGKKQMDSAINFKNKEAREAFKKEKIAEQELYHQQLRKALTGEQYDKWIETEQQQLERMQQQNSGKGGRRMGGGRRGGGQRGNF